jgi:hypothetical protein
MNETKVKNQNIENFKGSGRMFLVAALTVLGFVTYLALRDFGYIGLIQHELSTYAGMQVLLDLVIALVLVLVWMYRDAKKIGRSFLPWLVLTLIAGSFGPLLYLLSRSPNSKVSK